jgi:hypothetical protein
MERREIEGNFQTLAWQFGGGRELQKDSTVENAKYGNTRFSSVFVVSMLIDLVSNAARPRFHARFENAIFTGWIEVHS